MAILLRPAWGRNIQIGAYYEIGKGQFLSGNAITGGQSVMKKLSLNSLSVKSFAILQKTERFKALGISEDEALNISMDFIAVDGYGKYLKQPFTPGKYVEHVVVMTTTEEISSFDEALRERISVTNVPLGATHVVTGIQQGVRICLVLTHSTENIPDKENLNRKLEEISKEIAKALQKIIAEDKETVDCSEIEALLGETLRPELKLFSDDNTFRCSSIKEAIEEMRKIHKNVLGENGSLGRPFNYFLTRIKEFSTAFNVNADDVGESQEIPKKLAEKLLTAIDQLTILEGKMEELRNNSMLPADVQEKVKIYLEKCDKDRNNFRTSVEENLPKARLGDDVAEDELRDASSKLENSFLSEEKLQEFLESLSVERAVWLSGLLK